MEKKAPSFSEEKEAKRLSPFPALGAALGGWHLAAGWAITPLLEQ